MVRTRILLPALLVFSLSACARRPASLACHVLNHCPYQPNFLVEAIADDVNQRQRNQADAKREQTRAAFEQQMLAQASVLRTEAIAAARAGDCARVYALGQQVLLLPGIQIEGGYHDTVFLSDAGVATCIKQHGVCLQQRRPECTPPPLPPRPPPMSRADCATLRDEAFDRSLTEDAARRSSTLAALPKCAVQSPDDERNELAWQLTVGAAQEAVRGNCSVAIDHDRRVKELDARHHSFNWSRDPAIERCQVELVKYRADRDRCLPSRVVELRRAQAIADPQDRGRAHSAIPKCEPTR